MRIETLKSTLGPSKIGPCQAADSQVRGFGKMNRVILY